MRRSLVVTLVLAVVAALGAALTTATAAPTPSAGRDPDQLDVYTATVAADQLSVLAQAGIDVTEQRQVSRGFELDMVLNQGQADQLRGRGIDVKLKRIKGGQTVRQIAKAVGSTTR